MSREWYKNAWRRNVVDTHIEDWHPDFFSEFNANEYVNRLVDAGVDSAVVYAQSHTGHCNYPTKVGHMHEGLKGRDVFGEIIDGCRRHNIKVVAYYSLIYNNWIYNRHPDWRMINPDGREAAFDNRYGVCCPNSPYRDYIELEVREICLNYDFSGLRYDMCFWPIVCCCRHCRKRFKDEAGHDIPEKVDWENPVWVKFQRARERWLIEFSRLSTDIVKKYKSDASVEHQSSTYPLAWQWGVTTGLSKQCTFLQGDFYGGLDEQTFVCKLLYNLTPDQPAGYETSIAGALSVHASYKSDDLLKSQVSSALSNGTAFIFIDGIDPAGTLNPVIYKKMGRIFEETKPYDKYRGGDLCQDIAIYLSTESQFYVKNDNPAKAPSVFNDPDSHSIKDADKTRSVHHLLPHTESVINIVSTMVEGNIPFGVITKENLNDIDRYKCIILANVKMMSRQEVQQLKNYVSKGGCLYASKYTSLYHTEGKSKTDFQLKEVFGVSYAGTTEENITYMAPVDDSLEALKGYSKKYPISISGNQTIVKAAAAEVLATVTVPYTDPKDITKYASIHCNPPGIPTDNPAIVINNFGKGRVIYSAAELENQELYRQVFRELIRQLVSQPYLIESDAPKSVEITTFLQEDKKRYILNVCNFQKDLPGIPVRDINLKLNSGSKKVLSVRHLPDEKATAYTYENGFLSFVIPQVNIFEMYEICYE